jgi:sugar/nucleoside kinase (ribokinase family)
MQEHDVVGIGNAIVDIIARCDDAFLVRHGCKKGSMQLVDAKAVVKLYDDMGPAVAARSPTPQWASPRSAGAPGSSARPQATSSGRYSDTTSAPPG